MDTPLLDRCDAAVFLNISTEKVSRLVNEKRIPHIVLPLGEVRFDLADLQEWMRSHRQEEVSGGC